MRRTYDDTNVHKIDKIIDDTARTRLQLAHKLILEDGQGDKHVVAGCAYSIKVGPRPEGGDDVTQEQNKSIRNQAQWIPTAMYTQLHKTIVVDPRKLRQHKEQNRQEYSNSIAPPSHQPKLTSHPIIQDKRG